MNKYIKEFKGGYQDGRQDTRGVLDGKKISYEYAYNITKFAYRLLFLFWIISFFVAWLILKKSFFVSLLIGFIIGWLIYTIYIIVIMGLIKLIKKSKIKGDKKIKDIFSI